MHIFSKHQKEQVKIVDKIERQVASGALSFSTVEPTEDYDSDLRICLTSVHFPRKSFINKIQDELQNPLQAIAVEYYYRPSSLHMTIKNVRVINNPPHFTDGDVEKTKAVFARVIPKHDAFNVYFYRLLLLPANLMLVGTTDQELDAIHLELDQELRKAGIPDDKIYTNKKYFFCNVTLARFTHPISKEFRDTVEKISNRLAFDPYLIDSVSLITANASLAKCQRIETWKLYFRS